MSYSILSVTFTIFLSMETFSQYVILKQTSGRFVSRLTVVTTLGQPPESKQRDSDIC